MSEEKEKIPVEEVKFLPNAEETKGDADVEKGKPRNGGAFVGLNKDQLQRYADDPYWVRTRKILFITFWVVWVGMVAAAVIIIVLSPKCPPRPEQKWWETSVFYRADVRTFKDSDADGVGDLAGIAEKLGYVVDLVGSGGAVLLSTVFQTGSRDPLRRDVTDFKTIDGEIGNMDNLRDLVKAFHKKGVKVVLEVDPNHSSKEHPFFKDSQKNLTAYRNFYVWKASKPNDATKDAWNNDATRGEFYYGAHGGNLPGFNLKEQAVKDELIASLLFWLREEGVDGFLVSGPELGAGNAYEPESAEFVHELRAAFDAIGDDTGKDRALIVRLGGGGNATQRSIFYGSSKAAGANMIINDRVIKAVGECGGDLGTCLGDAVKASNNIVQESHQARHNGDRAWGNWAVSSVAAGRIASNVDARFIDAFNLLLLTLKGTPMVLYGDELGMKDVTPGNRSSAKTQSVMQWESGALGGFTTAQRAKYSVNGDVDTVNVKHQLALGHDSSSLLAFKSFVELRSNNSFVYGEMEGFSGSNGLVSFVRKAEGHPSFLIAVNLGEHDVIAPASASRPKDGTKAVVVVTTPGAHEGFKVGTKLDFENDKPNLLLKPGVGVVIKMPR